MSRIKLSIPDHFDYLTQMKLRIYDMNYGSHMGNDSVLSIVHEARVRFLASINAEEKNFYGLLLLMADSAIVYKKEAFYGDLLEIKISVSEIYSHGFELFYLISNVSHNLEIARIKTGMVCCDPITRKINRLPKKFAQKFR
ncbi:MAG: thioesterase [Flavobacteriales bacterium]|nr:thioesterase [Flavobacteriales bacterium]|tara:strand:+ start:4750 stop:5172 length:423 start_codon:yes stop_codon:yes gene_type:complete